MSLKQAVELAQKRELSDLERQGMIQGFEYTHELAWEVMKDYLEEQGFVGLTKFRTPSFLVERIAHPCPEFVEFRGGIRGAWQHHPHPPMLAPREHAKKAVPPPFCVYLVLQTNITCNSISS